MNLDRMNLDRPILSILIIISSIIIAIILVFRSIELAFCVIVSAIFLIGYLNPNKFKPELKNINDYPLLSRTRRRKLICSFSIGILGAAIFSTLDALVSKLENLEVYSGILMIAHLACLGLFIYAGSQFFNSRYAMALSDNSNADERDVQNINRAYKLSFRMIASLSVIIFFLIPELFNTFIAKDGEAYNFGHFFQNVSVSSLMFVLIFVMNLPLLVYAWLEPDPIPE